MERRDFLKMAALAAAGPLVPALSRGQGAAPKRPNVLLITVDDMNCDCVGVFGCKVKDTTPNLDRLAVQGIRFMYAHTQVANCMPSRNVMQTGRYPHTSGVEGFYQVRTKFPILPDLMRQNGYFAAIKGKVSHSTPYSPYPWDMIMGKEEGGKGNAEVCHRFTSDVIDASHKAGKSFYLLMNLNDPHVQFYGLGKGGKEAPDKNKPTRVFTEKDVAVPGFLPDTPASRKELAHYYSSVRRADDCVTDTLRALDEKGVTNDTCVIFLSDHGMPFPFVKTNVYHHSTRTPWIMRWPGKIKPGLVEDKLMISAIDFMPTVLEIAGIPKPEGLQGRSFVPLLLGQPQEGREFVIKEYNENSGGYRHPMRAVETRQFIYIFNPWSDGKRRFETATHGMQTYKEMLRIAQTDPAMAARLRMFDYRVVEEFYDCVKDPDALHNLIGDPKCRPEIDRLRQALEQWMIETKDPCLEAFQKRNDPKALAAYMASLEQAANERRAARRAKKRKSGKKGAGGEEGEVEVEEGEEGAAEGAEEKTGLGAKKTGAGGKKAGAGEKKTAVADVRLQIDVPSSLTRGKAAKVVVEYSIPEHYGEQPIQVTLKGEGTRKIERKEVKGRGTGRVEVEFNIPAEESLKEASFAAFVGADFDTCLRHAVTKPIATK